MAASAGTVLVEARTSKTTPAKSRKRASTPSRTKGAVLLEALPPCFPEPKPAPAHADPARREPTEEEIRLRAYHIYLERGRAPGHERDDWFRAERELRGAAA